MRNLIDLITYNSLITESRGLGARQSGEEFVSTTDPEDKVYVKSVDFYPDGATAYETEEERNMELERIVHLIPNAYVDLIGKFNKKQLAFGIAIFERPGDPTNLAFVKPFEAIHPDPSQNKWDNQKGIPGFKYNSKSAKKAQAGMTPQDILTTQQSNLNPDSIVAQIAAKFGDDSPLTGFARSIADGVKLPISFDAPEGMHFTAFRDYFCELLHPIALQTGNFNGNAGKAAMKFLGSDDFSNTTINFGKDKTEGLSDSILISPEGKKIKVSSKGSKGAAASTKNLLNSIEELGDSALTKKHEKIIEIIKKIAASGQAKAPLVLGIQYNIITEEDANTIVGFKKMAQTTLPIALGMKLSSGIKKLIADRRTKKPDNLNLYFHCIAAVAHKVADYINENTNFSEAASEILNNGALVQIYTKATQVGDKWTVKSFDSIWPGTAVTGVEFSAGKTYSSTEMKGNFTFTVLFNNATAVEDTQEPNDPGVTSPSDAEAAAPRKTRTEITPTKEPKKPPPESIAGRSRR